MDLPILCNLPQNVVLSLASMSPSPHFCLIPQPSFCLVLPPTTYTWTRNGQVITNSASYGISIQVDRSPDGFQNSRYRSTLTVTGRLPGVYQYSVTNRATSGMVTRTFTIESMMLYIRHNLYITLPKHQIYST